MGNICRSPTAEAVMAKLVAGAGLGDRIALDSAGTGGWHAGELPDPRARAAAAKRGIVMDHRARQFTKRDFDRFDLIVVMDHDNRRHVEIMAGGRTTPPVRLLRSYDPSAPVDAEVPDPYAGDAGGFEEVLDQCERACLGLLAQVSPS
jgi:protein-tyrosine phosphatase